MRKNTGFTLIELLVVIAIIALLMAILVPVLRSARNQARAVVCQVNLKQWGTTLNLYTEDNRGCFPIYNVGGEIIWFLRGSIPGSHDQNEESLRPVETRCIGCCPMATRTGRLVHSFGSMNGVATESWYGGTFDAYEMISLDRPFRTSYGFNGWLFDRDFDSSIPLSIRYRRDHENVRFDILRGRGNIPVLLDSVFPYSYPGEWGRLAPPSKEGWRVMGAGGGMDYIIGCFAINRHNEHVNGLFLDWSVRRIGIKELWTLKWNMQFNTANEWTKAGGVQPEDWPEWMRNFKDY